MKLRHAAALALACGFISGCFLPHREWSSRQAGVVLDNNSRRPIPGADVVMTGYWQAVTTTDGDGKFEIPETAQFSWFLIPFGDPFYDVTIQARGYQPDCYSALPGWTDKVVFLKPMAPGEKEKYHCPGEAELVPAN